MKPPYTLQPVKWLPDVPLFDANGKGAVRFTGWALSRTQGASQLRLKVRRIEHDDGTDIVLIYDKFPFHPLRPERQIGEVFVVLSLGEMEEVLAEHPYVCYNMSVAELDALITLFLSKVSNEVGKQLNRTAFVFNIIDVRKVFNV